MHGAREVVADVGGKEFSAFDHQEERCHPFAACEENIAWTAWTSYQANAKLLEVWADGGQQSMVESGRRQVLLSEYNAGEVP